MTVEAPAPDWLRDLPAHVAAAIASSEPMSRHTSLRVGGAADWYLEVTRLDDFAAAAAAAQIGGVEHLVIGEGTNLCVSDAGIRGLVIRNRCREGEVAAATRVDSGHNFMRLSLLALEASLSGLEFAIGIPGTIGGALVSNAGAYRANICDVLTEIEVVENGERKWVPPEWMEFSYRDSRLRRDATRPAVLLAARLALRADERSAVRRRAQEIQRQRILKQPWEPSAGSFFKNVNDRQLAESLGNLPDALRSAGVVPAAYLAESAGCKGLRIGGAGISPQHANFVVNFGGATASDVRAVADAVKRSVLQAHGVVLEEEVLCIGDW